MVKFNYGFMRGTDILVAIPEYIYSPAIYFPHLADNRVLTLLEARGKAI